MPKFKNVMAALAISTAITGGAIALGATSASAATTGWGGDWRNNNNFDRNCSKNCNNREDFTNLNVGANRAFVNFSECDKRNNCFNDFRDRNENENEWNN
jgi:hypothetical protein